MGRIVVTEFMSLDGVVEDPGGGEDYEHGGWSFEISRGDEGDRFKLDEAMQSDALLLGRRTYETFAASWPERGSEVPNADWMNNTRKYVVSTTLDSPEWQNSTVIEGDVAEALTRLKQENGKNIMVNGSATLVRSLLRDNLLDELRLFVHPVVMGSGEALFQGDAARRLIFLNVGA